MLPYGVNDVTLIQRIESGGNGSKTVTTFESVLFHRCSWKAVKTANTNENNTKHGYSVTCRIPKREAKVVPKVGDYLFFGKLSGDCPQTINGINDLLESHRNSGAIKVTSVGDFTQEGFPLPHYRLTGE